ncbi:Helix-turn-helix domain-containing protein [Parabacteroides chinchillae]|uniref:Helix-turn-helix domain-containing protein n=2 Tax=Parabacteroides chinchillae TaxID=871327 RepID=A0A8G2BWM6_9BACT|nr:Helix-turn-helix domain-containing protein [Parabacteroides chinchillae]
MITIESLVEQGANVKLEVTPTDLKMFAESIVQRTIMAQQEEQKAAIQREAEESYLNTKQVRELLNVCEGTLNQWAKRGYLVPVKVGNKNMYAKSDVRRVQTGGKSESVTSYCKKRNG